MAMKALVLILTLVHFISAEDVEVNNPIELSGPAGENMKFYTTKKSLPPDFNAAEINLLKCPDSFWILYDDIDFNINEGSNPGVPITVGNGTVDFTQEIKSIQGYDFKNPGVIGFLYEGFRDYGLSTDTSADNFPVQSLAVTGGVWNLFSDRNMGGEMVAINGKADIGPGFYPVLPTIVKSIKLLCECAV